MLMMRCDGFTALLRSLFSCILEMISESCILHIISPLCHLLTSNLELVFLMCFVFILFANYKSSTDLLLVLFAKSKKQPQ